MAKVVIVEDEETLLRNLAAKLQDDGFKVVPASDGEDGLDKIRSENPDLIILDIMLPKKDGLSVLREIRQAEIRTPVLMLTAMGEIDDKIVSLLPQLPDQSSVIANG